MEQTRGSGIKYTRRSQRHTKPYKASSDVVMTWTKYETHCANRLAEAGLNHLFLVSVRHI